MPKLQNRPPKYCKLNGQAVVYRNGRPIYLGAYGSPESKDVCSRITAEKPANPTVPLPSEEKHVTIRELVVGFLDSAKANKGYTEYEHYKIIVMDFLDELYGEGFPVDDFKPRHLKHVRTEMMKSGRFCRRVINRYTFRTRKTYARIQR